MQAGNRVLLSHRRGPGSLTTCVATLGPLASAGAVTEAAQAEVVFLAVSWVATRQVQPGFLNWEGRIVADANHAILAAGTFVDLGERTSSERMAGLVAGRPGVKPFNSLATAGMEDDPV